VAQEQEEAEVEVVASEEVEEDQVEWGERERAQGLGEAVFAPTAVPRLPTRWGRPATA